ncbi:caspase family protein [Streptomyces sp. NPDC047082]|uniref:caspase family protein n=1 Tax=Streptomyces sp. NPDC047082 TaxID=3155259 RepID=UPI0033EB6EE2
MARYRVLLDRTWQLTPNIINGEVTGFLKKAEPGDHLLIVLSGHGVHSDGKDYLIPEDIHPELSTFVSGCVEIDWRAELEHCSAAQIVFLIDACREGIERDTMGTSAWTSRKVAATLRRKVAYVYACSKAEFARYVRETDTVRDGHDVGTRPRESFSLFSRAVTDVLGGTASTLHEFRTSVQERVDALHLAYGKPGKVQHVRVLTEDGLDGFEIFPPVVPDVATDGEDGVARAWAETVTGHLVWHRTNPALGTTVDILRGFCGRLAGDLARACAEAERVLRGDPWYDRELPRRTAERLGFLLVHHLPERSPLSPTEAALLAVLPFAAQAHWARHAANQGLPEAELSDFLPTFPRLHRRLRTLEPRPGRTGHSLVGVAPLAGAASGRVHRPLPVMRRRRGSDRAGLGAGGALRRPSRAVSERTVHRTSCRPGHHPQHRTRRRAARRPQYRTRTRRPGTARLVSFQGRPCTGRRPG